MNIYKILSYIYKIVTLGETVQFVYNTCKRVYNNRKTFPAYSVHKLT